jgi:4-hydroxybenzoate polyprenyltransferase
MEHAIGAIGVLLVVAGTVSVGFLPWGFSAALLAYVVMNLGYSFWLKQKVMIDILVLAGFYTLRIVAGGAATGGTPSVWLLALSMFLFLSLAFLKRFDELVRLRDEGELVTDNRGYHVGEIELLQTMGSTCGYLSVLVLALYINSEQVVGLYARPRLLWLVCPLLLYWVSRAWLWARRGAIREDPLLFALKDRISWLCLVLVAVLALASM